MRGPIVARGVVAAIGMLLCAALASLASARSNAPDGFQSADAIAALCDRAGERAARATGVPLAVLRAISLTETGRRLNGRHQAWPWTVNMEGRGKWFDTREEALQYVRRHHARGATSFDVGCFQINYRWHGKAFRSIEDMFEPELNALYAGRFLRSLYGEMGGWSRAAGAYHSRTPKFAERYRARFNRILARLTGQSDAPMPVLAEPGVIPAAPVGWPVEGRGQMVARGRQGNALTDPFAPAAPQRAPTPPPRGPDHWVPPPPTPFGSVAAIELVPRANGLLNRPLGSLY